jgi:hypothetical protein
MNSFLSFLLVAGYFANPAPPILLKEYGFCQGSIVVGREVRMMCYFPPGQNCRNGTLVLALEKYRGGVNENAVYEIVDTVQVNVVAPARSLDLFYFTAADDKTHYHFVLYKGKRDNKPAHAKYLHHVLRVWDVSADERFVEVPPKQWKFFNPKTKVN